jgi:hypothetical protein
MGVGDMVIRVYDAREGEVEYEGSSPDDWVWVRFFDTEQLLPVQVSDLRLISLKVAVR